MRQEQLGDERGVVGEGKHMRLLARDDQPKVATDRSLRERRSDKLRTACQRRGTGIVGTDE
jgi:hypothetical protein